MADAVSKLYAEIGFKVNESGLKQAQKMLSEFAKQMSELNELTKKQASIYGVFAKERAKQDTEKEKQATEQRKAENKRIQQSIKETTHRQQLERMARKEELQDKRFQQKEQEHLWRMEERGQKRHSNNMLKSMKTTTNAIGRALRHSAKLLANSTQALWRNVVMPNLSGAVNVRDFMMYTGTNLSTLQGIQERFASVGSSMTREDIMGELSSVMDNLTKIRFGKGELGGLKLAGIQGFAAKGNVSKVLDMIEQATVGVDNQALTEVLNEIGFSGQRWLPYFRARQRVNKSLPRLNEQGQESLLDAQTSLGTFILGLQRSGEIMTSKFAPVIKATADKLIDFMNTALSNVNIERVASVVERIVNRFIAWLDNMSVEDIEDGINRFFSAIRDIADGLEWLADKLSFAKDVKRKASVGVEDIKKWAITNAVESYISRKFGVTPIVINNNQQVQTTVNANSNDEVVERVEEATRKGAQTAWAEKVYEATGTWVMARARGS